MYRSNSDSNSSLKNLYLGTGSSTTSAQDDAGENLLKSAPTLHQMSWDAPNKSVSKSLGSTQPGVISSVPFDSTDLFLYSTIPIVDSGGVSGPWINVTPPMHTSVSSIQIIRCHQSLVQQTAIVSQSGNVIQMEPALKKTEANWAPYTGPDNNTATGYDFFRLAWYNTMPSSDFPLDPDAPGGFVSLASLYLIQKLNLHPMNYHDAPLNVTLHDLENSLSELVASMFWTLGHIAPTYQVGAAPDVLSTTPSFLEDPQSPILLLARNATAFETSTLARLDLSVIAVPNGIILALQQH
ncbi:hypothetical protein MVEN_00267400 [Mycena venus]|uniref:Uncharacterized protein n=1 Tax=Mycena venus TaxID=2733690 RepID=A0A8H7DFC4_9AGAR|nr:hypothetical protein MVEN_00267400 [Mycena venus]